MAYGFFFYLYLIFNIGTREYIARGVFFFMNNLVLVIVIFEMIKLLLIYIISIIVLMARGVESFVILSILYF